MLLGYAHVSSVDQHTEQQETAPTETGCERVFIDRGISGSATHRSDLERMLDQLRADDVVGVTKLDRLGRSLPNVLDTFEAIEQRGAGLVSLAESAVDTTSAAGKLVFRIFVVVAKFERDGLRERTQEGIERARTQGTHLGLPGSLNDTDIAKLRTLRKQGSSYSGLAKSLRISRSTVRKYCS